MTFRAAGLDVERSGAGVRIVADGSKPKFKSSIEAISFSAERAVKRGQRVLYVTERCVFRLTELGLELFEVYDGIDIKKAHLSETAKKVGYLFQNPERQLFCATALQDIAFSLKHAGERGDADVHARKLLERFSMQDKADEFPLKFSRGEKQRLALLAVLAMRPLLYTRRTVFGHRRRQ
jgi:energy-coupling factor transporter ATP-binding protein EcfA2